MAYKNKKLQIKQIDEQLKKFKLMEIDKKRLEDAINERIEEIIRTMPKNIMGLNLELYYRLKN